MRDLLLITLLVLLLCQGCGKEEVTHFSSQSSIALELPKEKQLESSPSDTPSPTPLESLIPSPSLSPTPTPIVIITPVPTLSPSPTTTPTATVTPTPTPTSTPDPKCGNGICESGESIANCAVDCSVPDVCGNGLVERGEECDDGNSSSGDGCYNCKRIF